MLENYEKSTHTCVKTVKDITRALEYECEQSKRRLEYAEVFRTQCQTSYSHIEQEWGPFEGTNLMRDSSMVATYWRRWLRKYEPKLTRYRRRRKDLEEAAAQQQPVAPSFYSRAESDQAWADTLRRLDAIIARLQPASRGSPSSPLNESPSPSHSSAPTGGAHESAPCQSDAVREPPEPSPSLLIPQLPQAEPSAVAPATPAEAVPVTVISACGPQTTAEPSAVAPATPAEAVPVTVISACGPQSTAEDDAILTALAAKPVVCVSPSHHEWCSVLDTPDIPSSEHAHARELLHRDARPTVVRTVDLSHLLSIAYAHNRKLVAAR